MYPSGNENQSTTKVNFYWTNQTYTTKQKPQTLEIIITPRLSANTVWRHYPQLKLLSTLWVGKLICKLVLGMWHLGTASSDEEKSLVEQQGMHCFWWGTPCVKRSLVWAMRLHALWEELFHYSSHRPYVAKKPGKYLLAKVASVFGGVWDLFCFGPSTIRVLGTLDHLPLQPYHA